MPPLDSPLVNINTSTAKEIATLYDIDTILAERIVRYRQEYGYFRSPEDLTQVEGIELRHAVTLAPHIDWSIPEPPEAPKQREWGSAAIYLVVALALSWLLTQLALPDWLAALRTYDPRDSYDLRLLWIVTLVVAALTCFIISALTKIVQFLTRNHERARRFSRLSLTWAGLGFVSLTIEAISLLFFQGVSVQAMLLPCIVLMGALTFGPQLVVMWRPTLAYNPTLARTYDFGVVIGGPIFAWFVWESRNILPLWYLILTVLFGLSFVHLGVNTLVNRRSHFQQALDFLDPTAAARDAAGTKTWIKWLNTHLPDPEQQKLLKQALDKSHPPSRVRTLGGLVTIGAGGWIVATVFSAIVQLYAIEWWQQLTCYLFGSRCG